MLSLNLPLAWYPSLTADEPTAPTCLLNAGRIFSRNMLHDSWQVVMEIAVNHSRLKVTLLPRYFSNGSLGHCWVMTSSFAVEYFGASLQASKLGPAINLATSWTVRVSYVHLEINSLLLHCWKLALIQIQGFSLLSCGSYCHFHIYLSTDWIIKLYTLKDALFSG